MPRRAPYEPRDDPALVLFGQANRPRQCPPCCLSRKHRASASSPGCQALPGSLSTTPCCCCCQRMLAVASSVPNARLVATTASTRQGLAWRRAQRFASTIRRQTLAVLRLLPRRCLSFRTAARCRPCSRSACSPIGPGQRAWPSSRRPPAKSARRVAGSTVCRAGCACLHVAGGQDAAHRRAHTGARGHPRRRRRGFAPRRSTGRCATTWCAISTALPPNVLDAGGAHDSCHPTTACGSACAIRTARNSPAIPRSGTSPKPPAARPPRRSASPSPRNPAKPRSRPEDRLRHQGRHRPRVAARHRAGGLRPARALRPELHRRRQPRAPPGHDPPRALRLDGALLRRADRALRRRLPALARARADPPRAHLRQGDGLREARPRPAGRRWSPRRRSTRTRTSSAPRSAAARSTRCRTSSCSAQKEAEAQSASLRSRAKGDEGVHTVADLVDRFQNEVATARCRRRRRFGQAFSGQLQRSA